jgi:Protein of Unknown function (DUF2784)
VLLAARGLLALHVLFVGFTVLGLAAILAGAPLKWKWTVSPRFRIAHLAAIAFVCLRSWSGLACPLTTAELWLRDQAGASTLESGFDRVGWALVLRATDRDRFRRTATAWVVLTSAALLLPRVAEARGRRRRGAPLDPVS